MMEKAEKEGVTVYDVETDFFGPPMHSRRLGNGAMELPEARRRRKGSITGHSLPRWPPKRRL